ncbi:MAG: protein phosphatase 2C domain-containing protein [Oscillospiraceae bacterium]|nr:protein phosphatase 2C domain-containing protein [Oscillospiraceae bacterium]
MVLGSCYSLQGRSHKVTGTVCQDASVVKQIKGDWTVMAIADGVGSAPKSDIGSKTAVEVASDLCVKAFPIDGDDKAILALLRTSFNCAMREIVRIAEENGDELSYYDTTLDIVIFNGSSKLYFGHCGDGGIFVLNADGDYAEITTVQEGEEASSVIPLRNGNATWAFGVYEDEIAVVAAFTDGIRDKIVSPLLRNEKCTIDVPLANTFMFVDAYDMTYDEAFETLKKVMKGSLVYLQSPICKITDDITMGILVNTAVIINEDPIERYEKPNWVRIWADQIERLYPNKQSVDTVFRRHKLEQSILEDPDKVDLKSTTLIAYLDQYYPLTPEEAVEYNKKYPPKDPTVPTASAPAGTSTGAPTSAPAPKPEPKPDPAPSDKKPHGPLGSLLDAVKTILQPETGTHGTAPEIPTAAPEKPAPAPEKPAPAPEKPAPAPEKPAPAPEKPAPAPEKPAPAPEKPAADPESTETAPKKTATAPEKPTAVPEQPAPAETVLTQPNREEVAAAEHIRQETNAEQLDVPIIGQDVNTETNTAVTDPAPENEAAADAEKTSGSETENTSASADAAADTESSSPAAPQSE